MIILHGLGADGNDFVPVAHELDLAAVGPVRFVFPHAPTRPVTINGGYVMRAWYDIFGLDSRERREDERGLRESQALVEALIAKEKARGIPAARIVLAGFSQGCAMTLMTGLRHGERLAGPGRPLGLPAARREDSTAERHDANRDTPIFLAHGTSDPVIPIARARAVARRAGRAGPCGRVARVPDAALGVRAGDRRPESLACCACCAAEPAPADRPRGAALAVPAQRVLGAGGPNRTSGFSARAYSGSTFGIAFWMSLMRVGPDGCVVRNSTVPPLLAAAIFCHSVTPACGS